MSGDMAEGQPPTQGEIVQAENTCPECEGRGRLAEGQSCPTCEGTGLVTEPVGGGG